MNRSELAEMNGIAETFLSTQVVPLQPIGAVSRTAGLPEADHAGPQAAHADPHIDAQVQRAAQHFEDAIVSFQREIAGLYNKLKPLKANAPNHDPLHTLLLVMQQAHGIQTDLRNVARDIHTGNWGS